MSTTWSRRDLARAAAALTGGYLLAGCQPQRPSITTATTLGGGIQAPDQVTPDAVQALLDRRAQALLNGDEQAFLADLDQSNQELVERERLRFANLSQFEFSNVGFVLPQQLGGGATAEFSPVLQLTQLTVDDAPGGVAPAEAFRYALANRDGQLVATDVAPLVGDAAAQQNLHPELLAHAPWNTTPLRVLQAGSVWLAGDDTVADLETFAGAAQTQLGFVEGLWGDRLRFPGYVLFFSRNPANIDAWYGIGARMPSEDFQFDGLEIPLQGVRTNGQVYNGAYSAARIVVNLASIELNDSDPDSLMRHELAHAVTARAGAVTQVGFSDRVFATPRWAIEGFAEWVQHLENPTGQARWRALAAQAAGAGKFAGAPPASESFYGPDISFNYAVGASVFGYIEQAVGRDAAVEFYARVSQNTESPDNPLVARPAFDTITQEVVGAGAGAFLQQWDAFARGGA